VAETARVRALVSGQVQGVGFRDWVQRRAGSLGVAGAATNLDDGRVEVVAEGPRDAVESLLDDLRGAQSPGHVDGVDVTWSEPIGEVGGFGTE
jgi:acylphosphatase